MWLGITLAALGLGILAGHAFASRGRAATEASLTQWAYQLGAGEERERSLRARDVRIEFPSLDAVLEDES